MEKVIICLLSFIILLLVSIMAKYKRQILSICRQLEFLKAHESNKMITADIRLGGLGDLVDILNDRLDGEKKRRKAYEEKERLISDTYTNLSHDIRTPLTSLDGYFQLLEAAENEEDKKRYISVIQERITSLKEMLEEMFTFTKLKNESFSLDLSEIRAGSLLAELVLSYYEEWQKKGIIPDIELPQTPVWVRGNALALKRCVQNVIKNGLDHGEKKLKIVLKEEKSHAVISISNLMSNVGEVDVSRVFDRFYKADRARSKSSSGLGLSIAKEFVLHMHGEIKAEIKESYFIVSIRLDKI